MSYNKEELWTRSGIDFYTSIASGQFPSWSVVHKFGSNQTLGTSPEDIWIYGGVYTPPLTASKLEVLSDSADDANLGTGAWSTTLQGLNGNYDEVSEIVTLDGVTPVETQNDYIRLNRGFVSDIGTHRAGAAGEITIQITGAGAVQGLIQRTNVDGTVWNYGQTQIGRYTVPRGKTAFLRRVTIHNEGSKLADFVFYKCGKNTASAPFCTPRTFLTFSSISDHDEMIYSIPQKFSEMTDIYARARLLTGSLGRVSTNMEIHVFDGVL